MGVISGIFGALAVLFIFVIFNQENFYFSQWMLLIVFILGAYYFYKKKREIDDEEDEVKVAQIKSKAIKVLIGGVIALAITNVVFEASDTPKSSTSTKRDDEVINGQTKEFLEWQVKSGEWNKQGK